MFKLHHKTLLGIAGTVWLAVGASLLWVGIRLFQSVLAGASSPLVSSLTSFASVDNIVIVLIASALGAGYFKGRMVLRKAAGRETARIVSLPNPAPITSLYGPRFYILIVIMMGIGMAMRFFAVPPDIRGWVDVTVGAALIHGAMAYYGAACESKKAHI